MGKAIWSFGLVLALVIAGCAPSSSPTGGTASVGVPVAAAAPKRVVAVIHGDPHTLYQELNPASRVRGIDALEQFVNAGMALVDNRGNLQPGLAEQIPSIENGLWKVLPDGGMETTWRIRPGVMWHDGTPVSAEDLVFTARVTMDKDLPIFTTTPGDLIASVTAVDPRTVTVRWNQTFIEADTLFTTLRALPFPKHLLEKAYLDDKATFTDQPYWSSQFVGSGPFKLKEWVRSSHLVLEAFEPYALGRAKIDTIEVRFIGDDNTMAANLLAGVVEVTLGRALAGEQAAEVAAQWREGRMELAFENWIALFPQLLTPNPAAIGDARFRRALLHAVDRQQIVDALMPGQTSVGHSWLTPGQPDYREIEERNLVKYEYDLRRSAQILEGMGFSKGGDGMYRDPSGQRVNLELRTTADDDLRQKTLFALVDFWQRAGFAAEPTLIPRQRAADLEYRATFPGFELVRQPQDVRGLRTLHSRFTPLPENNFRTTGNRTRYQSAELDALGDAYFVTIPRPERMQIMGRIVNHISEQVVIMGMLYNVSPTLVSNRLVNVGASGNGGTSSWNSHLWDIKS